MSYEAHDHRDADFLAPRKAREMSDDEFLAAAKEIFVLYEELAAERASFV